MKRQSFFPVFLSVMLLSGCSESGNDGQQLTDQMDGTNNPIIADGGPLPTQPDADAADAATNRDAAQMRDQDAAVTMSDMSVPRLDAQTALDQAVTIDTAIIDMMPADDAEPTSEDTGPMMDTDNCRPIDEMCNGLDDDCDGRTDENAGDARLDCQTNLLGVCQAGQTRCNNGQIQCVATRNPGREVCDSLDNDCDGTTDENAPNVGDMCQTGEAGICGPGTRQCENGQMLCVSNSNGEIETCDRSDEDCDGRIDEDAAGAGELCDPGWARPDCPRRARTVCQGGQLICEMDPHPADPCNGEDDDCDGRIGEDVRGLECDTEQLGQCAQGSLICEADESECVAAFEPNCEVVNQLDDDCDGAVDEAADRFCSPPERQLTRFCLTDNNQNIALDMTVDPLGEIFVTRASLIQGHLYLTQVNRDGTHSNSRIQSRVALFPNRPIFDTDVTIANQVPHVCYRNARSSTLYYAYRSANGDWVTETVAENGDAGIDCAVAVHNDRVFVAYRHAGQLFVANRSADGQWSRDIADSVANSIVGIELDMVMVDGTPFIVHRDSGQRSFRITTKQNNRWVSVAAPGGVFDNGIGFRPRIWVDDNQVTVIHGDVPPDPDIGSDGNLYISSIGRDLNGVFRTENLDAEGHGGGQAVMSFETGLLIAGRYRLRSALGFREDGLELYKLTDVSSIYSLEAYTIADRRHTFKRLSLMSDPFGLPIIGFADEGSRFGGDNGFGRVCFYRPNDADADHVPDVIEDELGTDPDRSDTDGDGRTDGEEILIDGTDPLQR
ncbi:MAG: MopE-related protein [Myxococcota bacterium]|nr:MopE-related protein [Myxococcota bacterium]